MVIAFYNIYFGLLTICDWFFFIYVVCHISIFFNVLLLIIAFKGSVFSL